MACKWKKIRNRLTDDMLERNVVFAHQLQVTAAPPGWEISIGEVHEVKRDDPDRDRCIARLTDVDFFKEMARSSLLTVEERVWV